MIFIITEKFSCRLNLNNQSNITMMTKLSKISAKKFFPHDHQSPKRDPVPDGAAFLNR